MFNRPKPKETFAYRYGPFQKRSRIKTGCQVKLNKEYLCYRKNTKRFVSNEYWGYRLSGEYPEICFQVEFLFTPEFDEEEIWDCELYTIPIQYLDCFEKGE